MMLVRYDALPTRSTVTCVLREITDLKTGKQLHACIINHADFWSDVRIGTSLVSMYGRCSDHLEDALRAFQDMPEKNPITWNAIVAIAGRCHQNPDASRMLFEQMLVEGCVPTSVTYTSLVQTLSRIAQTEEGKRLHSRIICDPCLIVDVSLANALLVMYSKDCSVDYAQKVFDHSPKHNVVTWTALISSYGQQGDLSNSILAFEAMQSADVIPNTFTLVTLISACASQKALSEGKWLHFLLFFYSLNLDTVVVNALIRMYSMCDSFEDALKMLDDLDDRDIVSWTTIISACAGRGLGLLALQQFRLMRDSGFVPDKASFLSILDAFSSHISTMDALCLHVSILSIGLGNDIMIGTALINTYGKCCETEYAHHTFDCMVNRNLVTWNTMIAVHSQHKEPVKAFELFYQMQNEAFIPDKETFIGAIDACADKTRLSDCNMLHAKISCNSFGQDIALQTAIIHMHGKNGNLQQAWSTFYASSMQGTPLWNAMIVVLSAYGKADDAEELFDQMHIKGVTPDIVTFMGLLLACNHSGLVAKGWYYMWMMYHKYGIQPDLEHFNCMVDLLGRAGCLYDADLLIQRMSVRPDITTWTALLSACKTHLDLELGDRAAVHASQVEPEDSGTYISLSNLIVVTMGSPHGI